MNQNYENNINLFKMIIENPKNLTKLPKEYLNESNIALAERLKTLACSKNVNISSLQTAALISDSNLNVFAQIGTKNPRRLNEILKYSDLKLSKDEIEWLLAGETNKY